MENFIFGENKGWFENDAKNILQWLWFTVRDNEFEFLGGHQMIKYCRRYLGGGCGYTDMRK